MCLHAGHVWHKHGGATCWWSGGTVSAVQAWRIASGGQGGSDAGSSR
jgi:hypothetical protein